MRTKTTVAAVLATGAVAAALIATPALASGLQGGQGYGQNTRSTQQLADCDGTGTGTGAANRYGQTNGAGNGADYGMANGRGNGYGMANGAGNGPATGVGANLANVPSGTLTEAQKTALASMAEEEKLAHDLYVAFAAKYDVVQFSRIANAETRHLAEVRTVLDRYDITDPTAGKAAGAFASAEFQKLYNDLLAQGSAKLDAAYAAARSVESADIADLKAAMDKLTTAPDVLAVYQHLLAGSQHHLVAFGG
jgi:hypothetical protein